MQSYKSLTQIAVEQLRESVFEGTLPPGAHLNIAELAKQFKTSAVPVREALRNLEAEGLVDFLPNKGFSVKTLTAAEAREQYLIRVPLEETAAAEAALRWKSPKQVDALEGVLKKMDSASNEAWLRLHDQFHIELNALAGLPSVAKLIALYRGQMRLYTRIYFTSDHKKKAQAEHYKIVECLRRRDTERVREIVREHLRRPAQGVITALSKNNAEILPS